MPLPIVSVVMPSNLAGKQNGRLPVTVLRSHRFPGYKQDAQAHNIALRCFLAMAAGCYAATGVRLTITSLADAYRSYARQYNTFHDRYEKISLLVYLVTRPSRRKQCMGSYWRLVSGATAACPGTSNHGWGLAFDVALWIAGRIAFITSHKGAWTWIQANASRYGFSWEMQSEEWHLRYVDGDDIPDAVLRYEAGTPAPEPPVVVPPVVVPPPPTPGIPPAYMMEEAMLIARVNEPGTKTLKFAAVGNAAGWVHADREMATTYLRNNLIRDLITGNAGMASLDSVTPVTEAQLQKLMGLRIR